MAMSPLIILGGPTASGKSQLALSLRHIEKVEIVNADASQLYQDIPILSAQPSQEDQQQVPHWLYGIYPACHVGSLGEWIASVRAIIQNIHGRGNIPVVVGGTGMYLKTLVEGLSPIPAIPIDVREGVRQHLKQIGNELFHGDLSKIDPVMAARLPAGDSQRMARAYEVMVHTGKSLALWQQQKSEPFYPRDSIFISIILPPRAVVYRQCDDRFIHMLKQGALDEVRALRKEWADPEASNQYPAAKALGVRSLLAHIEGRITCEEAVEIAKTETRHFAKRQYTWFKHQFPGAHIFEESDYAHLTEYFQRRIQQFLLTHTL